VSILADTSPTTNRVMMTEDEATRTHKRILARDKAQSRDMQSMYDLDGWKVLGYASWDEYLSQAFDYSKSYLSRLNANIKVNHQLGTGETPLPERQTRPLNRLPDTLRSEAYETAKALAKAENGDLQVRHMEMASEQVELKQTVRDSGHRVISVMMDAGDVSPKTAQAMCEQLDILDPSTYSGVIQIIGEHGLADPLLIPEFADMINRDSRTLARVMATGYINDKPIGQASLEDLKAEKLVSQSEIIGEKQEQARQKASEQGKLAVIAHVVTVYENAPERTLKSLKRALSDEDLKALKELIA